MLKKASLSTGSLLWNHMDVEKSTGDKESGVRRNCFICSYERYIRVCWQGDKAAWEGLLRNVVCGLYQLTIILCALHKIIELSI